MKSSIMKASGLALLALAVTACPKKEPTDSSTALLGLAASGATTSANGNYVCSEQRVYSTSSATVDINFAVHANAQADFTCGSSLTITTASGAARTVTPLDMRFYVSQVRLIKSDGTQVPVDLYQGSTSQVSCVALLDFENASGTCTGAGTTAATNTKITIIKPDSYATDTYVGVAFDVGLPPALNRLVNASTASSPAPLVIPSLYWSWTSGYKFTKIELKDSASANPLLLHVGSTGCTTYVAGATPVYGCKKDYRGSIVVTKAVGNLDLSTDKVVLDLPTLLSGYDSANSQGCMPGDGTGNCQAILHSLGYTGTVGGANTTFTGASTPGANAFVIR